MTTTKLLLYILITFAVLTTCEPCNNQTEDCVELNDCQVLFQLRNKLPLSKPSARILRNAVCDLGSSSTKVCCPKNGVVAEPPQRPIIGDRFAEGFVESMNLETCGIQFMVDKIYNGVVTELEEFPWMALLAYRSDYGVVSVSCGGTLISKKYILTAAHCVTGPSVEKLGQLIAVRLGEYDTQSQLDCDIEEEDYCAPPPIDVYVQSTHPHPNYKAESSDRHNDIALIELATAVNFTKFVQPICLPDLQSEPLALKEHNRLTISGWGKTEVEETGSGIKLKAKVPLVGENECKASYHAKGIKIARSQLCAGGEKQDSCEGDSGGPLMWEYKNESRWYSIGVISYGSTPCAKLGVPAVYTRTASYLEWIRNTINS